MEIRISGIFDEFREMESEPGEKVYGFLVQVYLTNLLKLPNYHE